MRSLSVRAVLCLVLLLSFDAISFSNALKTRSFAQALSARKRKDILGDIENVADKVTGGQASKVINDVTNTVKSVGQQAVGAVAKLAGPFLDKITGLTSKCPTLCPPIMNFLIGKLLSLGVTNMVCDAAGVAACQAAGLGPEDPLADICSAAIPFICGMVVNYVLEKAIKTTTGVDGGAICTDLKICQSLMGAAQSGKISPTGGPTVRPSGKSSHASTHAGSHGAGHRSTHSGSHQGSKKGSTTHSSSKKTTKAAHKKL